MATRHGHAKTPRRNPFYVVASILVFGLSMPSTILEPVDAARSLLASNHILFVFGDSYVDVGNSILVSAAFFPPYGSTYPGFPTGRFSDGRVLSDFIAKGLQISSPPAYNNLLLSSIANGINFAEAGSGVYESPTGEFGIDRLSVQIERFENVVATRVYSVEEINSAYAVVAIDGNDYKVFSDKNGYDDLSIYPPYIASVVSQIAVGITRLSAQGLRKFIVAGLQPIGCLPFLTGTTNNYTACVDSINNLGRLHNQLLVDALETLKSSLPGGTTFLFLDEFKSFSAILANLPAYGFDNDLAPCCSALGDLGVLTSCGRLGTLCKAPEKRFFWDLFHPTDAAWKAVYALYSTGQGYTAIAPNLPSYIAA